MCKKAKTQYNILTLRPRTTEDVDGFWLFRCQDISKMVYVEFAFCLAWWFYYVATVIDQPAMHSLGQTLSILLMIIIGLLIFLLKRRAKEHFVYLLLIFSALL